MALDMLTLTSSSSSSQTSNTSLCRISGKLIPLVLPVLSDRSLLYLLQRLNPNLWNVFLTFLANSFLMTVTWDPSGPRRPFLGSDKGLWWWFFYCAYWFIASLPWIIIIWVYYIIIIIPSYTQKAIVLITSDTILSSPHFWSLRIPLFQS